MRVASWDHWKGGMRVHNSRPSLPLMNPVASPFCFDLSGRYAWQPRDPKNGGEHAIRGGLCDSSRSAACGWNGLAHVWLPHHTKTPGKLWLLLFFFMKVCGEPVVSSLLAELVGNIHIHSHHKYPIWNHSSKLKPLLFYNQIWFAEHIHLHRLWMISVCFH